MIKLFLNDFSKAKRNENPPVATLLYSGFIQQKTNETFFCYAKNISFAGAIQVDLIDACGVVVQNIDSNFFYSEVNTDIYFEFGNIGTDFYTRELYLKITDLINDNVYYSNAFLVTDYQSNLSSRFDFKNKSDVYYQSIRIAKCYHQDIEDKNEFSEYTETSGKLVRYKNTTTDLNRYNIEAVDFYIGRWLNELFNYDLLFLDSQRVVVSEYKQGTRKGDTNFLDSEFLVNPQTDFYNWQYQLFEGLEVISLLPINNGVYTLDDITPILAYALEIIFNKSVLPNPPFNCKVYKNNVLIIEHTDIFFNINTTTIGIDLSFYMELFTDGNYSIVIAPNQITSGVDFFEGFTFGQWNFTIASVEFDNTEFSNDFLI
jgi:hypothetical protein